jgi:hypothetical protein
MEERLHRNQYAVLSAETLRNFKVMRWLIAILLL